MESAVSGAAESLCLIPRRAQIDAETIISLLHSTRTTGGALPIHSPPDINCIEIAFAELCTRFVLLLFLCKLFPDLIDYEHVTIHCILYYLNAIAFMSYPFSYRCTALHFV